MKIKNQHLCYHVWIEAFSENHEENEILLREVEVFRNDPGDLIYAVSGMYTTRNNTDLILEFPIYNNRKKGKENEQGK